MNKEPETYEELIRYKRCVDLSSYYDLSKEELDNLSKALTSEEENLDAQVEALEEVIRYAYGKVQQQVDAC